MVSIVIISELTQQDRRRNKTLYDDAFGLAYLLIEFFRNGMRGADGRAHSHLTKSHYQNFSDA